MSDEFKFKTGLRQGDVFSPIFFNIALEIVLKKIKSKFGGVNLEDITKGIAEF